MIAIVATHGQAELSQKVNDFKPRRPVSKKDERRIYSAYLYTRARARKGEEDTHTSRHLFKYARAFVVLSF